MARPIKIKINFDRILEEHLYEGKNGRYLNLVAWENKNGTGQFGDTHFVVQDVSKQARDAGAKGPILGNLTLPEDETPTPPPPRQQTRPAPRPNVARQKPPGTIQHPPPESYQADMEEDSIPF